MNTITKKWTQAIVILGLLAGGQAMADICDVTAMDAQQLRDVLDEIYFTNESKDKAGLIKKTREADEKYGLGKYCDAGFKLDDYAFKIMQLDNSGKATGNTGFALSCAQDLSAAWKSLAADDCAVRDDPPRGPKNK